MLIVRFYTIHNYTTLRYLVGTQSYGTGQTDVMILTKCIVTISTNNKVD